MENITIGRIVEFHPNNNENGLKLPNGMKTAPAIVTQVFGEYINLDVFTSDPNGDPVKQAWSICHKSAVTNEGVSYWDWFPRV